MKTVIKISLALALLCQAGRTRAETPAPTETSYFSTRAVLAAFFPKSERVTYRTLVLDPPLRARLRQRLGYAPARDRYTIFVAQTQGKVDGYAVIDDEVGLHQPITFATRLSTRGIIERVEIMVYREPRGDEVRDARFRKQFEGKTAQDPLRLDRDIDAVSGATISSASTAVAVRRAAVLVEELTAEGSALASTANAPLPAAPAGLGATPRRTTVSR
ncbi:MAG TPA: FMN-binding protein [Polyangia bacterium]|nr:FMN-binding protein [Polyangia bacterium]